MKHEQLRITQVTALPQSSFHYFYNLINACEQTHTHTHTHTHSHSHSFSQDDYVQVYYGNNQQLITIAPSHSVLLTYSF